EPHHQEARGHGAARGARASHGRLIAEPLAASQRAKPQAAPFLTTSTGRSSSRTGAVRMEMSREGSPPVRARLGLFDAVCIIIGIVIGSTIYKSPQLIMSAVASPAWGLGAWALGGALSLIGALCYAELTSTYPRDGGDYVYLSRAFGPWCGFLFGWAQLSV